MNLSIYVPMIQQYSFFTYRTWIGGMQQETNPILGGVALLYNLLTKQDPSAAAQAASIGGAPGQLSLTLAAVAVTTRWASSRVQAPRMEEEKDRTTDPQAVARRPPRERDGWRGRSGPA